MLFPSVRALQYRLLARKREVRGESPRNSLGLLLHGLVHPNLLGLPQLTP